MNRKMRLDAIKNWSRVRQGRRIVFCDKEIDVLIDRFNNDDLMRYFVTVSNPNQVGILESFLGYLHCRDCDEPDVVSSHCGSRYCESGSIASGGSNTHCACDTCF